MRHLKRFCPIMIPDQEKIVKNVWKKNAKNGGQNWIFYVPSQDINFFFRQNFRMKRLGKNRPGKRRKKSKDHWQKRLEVYSYSQKRCESTFKGGNAGIVEEFAHISNLQVNRKTELGDKIGSFRTSWRIEDIESFKAESWITGAKTSSIYLHEKF